MWKKIILDGQETRYSVSSEGGIRNDITGRQLKGTYATNEYHTVQLRIDGTSRSLMVHRLVAEAFCDNPNHYNIVDHIDQNKYNNCASNLRWVEARTNALNCNNPRGTGYRAIYFKGEFDPDYWKPVLSDNRYMINRDGDVGNAQQRNYLSPQDRNGYKRVNLLSGRKSVHILVWEAFHGQSVPEDCQIDHIDGNKDNNNLDNLRMVSRSENMKNAYANGHLGKREVSQFDPQGNLVATYSTITEAAEAVGVTFAAVRSALERQGTCQGYYWLDEGQDISQVINSWVPEGYVVIKGYPTFCINRDGDVYGKRNKRSTPVKYRANGEPYVVLNAHRLDIKQLLKDNFESSKNSLIAGKA